MTPARIQYELKKLGITQKQIAIEERRSEMMVSKTIYRETTSRPMMEAIARRIGKKPETVFPDKYRVPERQQISKAA